MAIDMLPPPMPNRVEESASDGPPGLLGVEQQPTTPQPTKYSPVRLLSDAEIATLEPVFSERGAKMPGPHSFFVGSVDEKGEVAAFLVIQLMVHAEPLWIRDGAGALFRSLVHEAERVIAERVVGGCDVYLFAPAGKVAQMAATAGMQMEPWTVWSKHVEGQPIDPSESESGLGTVN